MAHGSLAENKELPLLPCSLPGLALDFPLAFLKQQKTQTTYSHY